MPFAPLDLLASVIAAYPSRFTGAYGLTIQNRGTRVWIATCCLPHLFPQPIMDLPPDSAPAPAPEIVIDGAPRWKIMRQQFPGTATAHGIENAVEELAAAVFWRAATAFAGRHERYQGCPFGIGEIGIVSSSRRNQLLG